MTLRLCTVCGAPSEESRCVEHRGSPKAARTAERGYGGAWQRLSRRAREMSPLCEDCGTTEDLTLDHSPEAWRRHEAGLSIRLRDVAVVCRSCNAKRGRARPNVGEDPLPRPLPDPRSSQSLRYTPPDQAFCGQPQEGRGGEPR